MSDEVDLERDWADLREALPLDVVDEIKRNGPNEESIGLRSFLSFVDDADCAEALALKAFLWGDRGGHNEPRGASILREAIKKWTSWALNAGRWKQSTVRGYRIHLMRALEVASQIAELKIPYVPAKTVPFPRVTDSTPFPRLGDLDWPEFKSIPASERDACALDLVRSHGLAVFEANEKLFNFGIEAMNGTPQGHRRWERELDSLRFLLQSEHRAWSKTTRSVFAAKWDQDLMKSVVRLAEPAFWADMGVPWTNMPDPARKTFATDMKGLVADTVLACFGPTNQGSLGAQVLYAAETGWNRQPVKSLTTTPYLYRSSKNVRMGSARFMASFKNRASHHVVGSDTNSVSRGIELDRLDAIWDQLCSDPNFRDEEDYASVAATSDLISVMDRYATMSSAIRPFCDQSTMDLYFIAVSRAFKGGIRVPAYDMGAHIPEGPASREGATFSSTRKSYLAVYRGAGASVTETREAASHRSGQTLEVNYLSDASAVAEHIDAHRLFQNGLQAMIIDGKMALKLKISPEVLAWFSHCATASGIRSAFGLGAVAADSAVREDFVFFPQDAEFADLYLTHKALKIARQTLGQHRWEVQGAYLYEMVIATFRLLVENGFRADFLRTARATRSLLRQGKVALPPVLEI